MKRIGLIAIFISLIFTISMQAQDKQKMSFEKMSVVLDSLSTALTQNYAFPERVPSIIAELRKRIQSTEYSSTNLPEQFAQKLSGDLSDVSEDLHFAVGLDPGWIAGQKRLDDPAVKEEVDKANFLQDQQKNFGFQDVRILEGNVGYINFTYFADPDYAHEAAEAVMRIVENTDALIIDQRYNNGGYLEMAQLLASYFFPADEEQVLFDYYYLDDGKRIEKKQWVLPYIPGKRMIKTPLYILTSSTSFSAAEWFAYVLKNIGRAIVVGENTAGGAHPVTRIPIDNRFFIQVPIGEIKGPVSKKDFEGEGVKPQISIPAYKALNEAHRLAIRAIVAADTLKTGLPDWYFPIINARQNPIDLSDEAIDLFVGNY